jgi:hypothetical protein
MNADFFIQVNQQKGQGYVKALYLSPESKHIIFKIACLLFIDVCMGICYSFTEKCIYRVKNQPLHILSQWIYRFTHGNNDLTVRDKLQSSTRRHTAHHTVRKLHDRWRGPVSQ